MKTDNDPRIERLKEVLSSSYPRVENKDDLAPLPQSIINRLHPKEERKESFFAKMLGFIAQPLPALGAAAVLTICAVLLFQQSPPSSDPGSAMRSGGDSALTPQLVLINASSEQVETFEESGYFPEDLLSSATSFSPGERPAVVLDWKARTITRHVAGEESTTEPMAESDEEVLEQVLLIYQEAGSE